MQQIPEFSQEHTPPEAIASAPAFELRLTAIAHGGAALGRYEGRVVFVPYALPGEKVQVEVVQDKDRYAHARMLKVLEPSPDRVEPPCPHFGPGRCGGCQWQHIGYEAQLRFKAGVVTDQLTRIGGFAEPPVRPTLPDPTGWTYRNHAQFHPTPNGRLGFRTTEGRQVIPIRECPILHPLLAELYAALDFELPGLVRLSLRAGITTEELMLVFETQGDEPPALETDLPLSCVLLLADGTPVNLIGYNHLTEVVAGRPFRVSAPSFFQVNTEMAGELVRLVVEYLGLRGEETVLDGYCGVGLFAAHLAPQARRVVGVELAPIAVADARHNTADLDNVEIVQGAVEEMLPRLDLDAAVVDPPRSGLDRFALDALVEQGPARLVYVSCDPATLARDGKRLAVAGYRLVEVQPVDLFPQTYHIETVSLWVRG